MTVKAVARAAVARDLFSARNTALAVASIVAGAATVLAGVGLISTSGYLISRAGQRPPILDLMLVFVTVRFFGLARPALRYAERLVSHDLTFRILLIVRRWFIASLLPLSQGQLSSFRAGDLLSRLATDVDTLQESWLRFIAPGIVAVFTATAVVWGVSFADVRLAWTVLALMIFTGLIWSWVAHHLARGFGAEHNEHRRALSSDLVMVTQGLDDILAFGYEARALERVKERQQALDGAENAYGRRLALHAAVGNAATYLALCLALALTLSAAAAGELPPVWIAAIGLGIVAAFEAVEALPSAWQFAEQTRESARRLREVITTTPAVAEEPQAIARPGTAAPSVEFLNAAFSYGSGQTVLHDVSFRVAAGEHVALVGATGSGKSTALALVIRAWDASAGTVSLDGVDVRHIRIDDLRSRIAVMPQQIHVFNWTLRENVRLARPSASDHEVLRALDRARLGEFVKRLPSGLDTIMGEFGSRLSAGERQRLGFARILLTDASLVLVDEPTANLDVECERALLEELSAWAAGRTMVIASHRPAVHAVTSRALEVRGGSVAG